MKKKKKTRHSAEFKAKILSQLETSSQADLARLYKIDRRLIGKWSKPANKEKILNVVGKRHTFRIDGGNKSWWPELENELLGWFKQQRQKGACVSGTCLKVQACVIYDNIYRNTTVVSDPFSASRGWLENFLKRKNLVLRRITAQGRDLPKNFRALSLEYFSRNNVIFKKANFDRNLLMNMDETSVYVDFPSAYTYEECGVKRVKATTAGQEQTRQEFFMN